MPATNYAVVAFPSAQAASFSAALADTEKVVSDFRAQLQQAVAMAVQQMRITAYEHTYIPASVRPSMQA